MTKILLILLWPAGLAVIVGVAALLARRPPTRLAGHAGTPAPRPGRHGALGDSGSMDRRDQALAVIRFFALAVGGMIVVWGIMTLLGLLVVHAGPTIDKPIYHWTVAHRVGSWAKVMDRATKIGNIWTCWGASLTAAACLAATWRRKRWLPPVALCTLIVGDHFVVHFIHHFIHRVGTPNSPLGTFPSGGAERSVVFYGLVAYLIWREFSGSRRGAIWAAAAVAALAFNEGYSRGYLTLHWLTDILSGLVYGILLLTALVVAVRAVAGPPHSGPARLTSADLAAQPREPSPESSV